MPAQIMFFTQTKEKQIILTQKTMNVFCGMRKISSPRATDSSLTNRIVRVHMFKHTSVQLSTRSQVAPRELLLFSIFRLILVMKLPHGLVGKT
jgi:hypothetical protein